MSAIGQHADMRHGNSPPEGFSSFTVKMLGNRRPGGKH
jgi:hypothetical protein